MSRMAPHQHQAAVLEFDTLEDLDTLMSPMRLRLLSCFLEASTVKEAAAAIDVQMVRIDEAEHAAGSGEVVDEPHRGAGDDE